MLKIFIYTSVAYILFIMSFFNIILTTQAFAYYVTFCFIGAAVQCNHQSTLVPLCPQIKESTVY